MSITFFACVVGTALLFCAVMACGTLGAAFLAPFMSGAMDRAEECGKRCRDRWFKGKLHD